MTNTILIDYPDPEYSTPEIPSHRMGRMIMHAELEAERDRKPRPGIAHALFFVVALMGGWLTLILGMVWLLRAVGF